MQNDKRQGKHEHWITYQDEITLVLNILNEKFGFGTQEPIKNDAKTPEKFKLHHILATHRSGFHVHIGNGRGTSLPFSTVKNVFCVFVACERLLDRLSGTRDITGAKLAIEAPKAGTADFGDRAEYLMKSYAYSKPISAFLLFAAHIRRTWEEYPDQRVLDLQWRENRKHFLDNLYPQAKSRRPAVYHKVKFGMDIDSWLALVDGAKDIKDVRDFTCNHRKNCTINLSQLCDDERSGPEELMDSEMQLTNKLLTIEFRQHAGTLLPVDALSFVDFVAKLTLCCDNEGQTGLRSGIRLGGKLRALQPLANTAFELIRSIGCEQETLDFYRRQMSGSGGDVAEKLGADRKFIEKHQSEIPGAIFALIELKRLRESIRPENVEGLIMKKLLAGGYGQFRVEDLQAVLPSNTPPGELEKLIIGYRVPLNFEIEPAASQNKGKTPVTLHHSEDDGQEAGKKPVSKALFSFKSDDHPKGEGSAKQNGESRRRNAGSSRPSGWSKGPHSNQDGHQDHGVNGRTSSKSAGTRKGPQFNSHHV